MLLKKIYNGRISRQTKIELKDRCLNKVIVKIKVKDFKIDNFM